MATVTVDFAAPVEDVYRYLSHPANRPEWQSSLRRIDDLAGDGSVGTTWLDVTSVGARPRMTITAAESCRVWAETGTWHGIEADLRLDFLPTGAGTRVVATVDLRTRRPLAPLGVVLRRLAPVGIRGDLQRAAKVVGSGPDRGEG